MILTLPKISGGRTIVLQWQWRSIFPGILDFVAQNQLTHIFETTEWIFWHKWGRLASFSIEKHSLRFGMLVTCLQCFRMLTNFNNCWIIRSLCLFFHKCRRIHKNWPKSTFFPCTKKSKNLSILHSFEDFVYRILFRSGNLKLYQM